MNDKKDIELSDNEKRILLDHNYDGILELDNPLPNWWKISFYLGIIFAIIYFIAYHIFNVPSLEEEFNKEWALVKEVQNKFNLQNAVFDENKYQAILKDDGVNKGLVIYQSKCLPCHKEGGKGGIGPNLTDEFWLRAKGTPATIYPVVFNGVPKNGMPSWNEQLSVDEIYQVVSYVQTLHHTHAPGGTPADGELIKE